MLRRLQLDDKKRAEKTSRAKQWLNTGAASKMTPDLLTERDPDGDVRGWLRTMARMMTRETTEVVTAR